MAAISWQVGPTEEGNMEVADGQDRDLFIELVSTWLTVHAHGGQSTDINSIVEGGGLLMCLAATVSYI